MKMDSVLKKPVDRLTIVFAVLSIVLVGLSGPACARAAICATLKSRGEDDG